MKVLVVGTGGALGASGITTMADQMTRTLAKMGHEPTRLVAGAQRRRRPSRLNLQNVVAVFTEAAAVARAARRTRTDVVWLHTFGVPTLPALRTLAQVLAVRAVRRPIIVQFHAFGLAEQVSKGDACLRFALRGVARWSGGLVALREIDAAALRAAAPLARVSILPNWVEVPIQAPPLPSVPPFTVVFVGGLVARKGVSQLIDAMRLLGDLPMQLRLVGGAGDDGEEVADSIRRSAEDLVQIGRVVFVGQLDAEGVRTELVRANVFVLPSRLEGTPMALLEALAQGRPVIVGDAGTMAEIVGPAECGVVLAATTSEAIASVLRQVQTNPSLLVDQGRRGHQVVHDDFSVSRATALLSAILGDL